VGGDPQDPARLAAVRFVAPAHRRHPIARRRALAEAVESSTVRIPFAPPPRDPRADDLLGEIPAALFDEHFYLSCELVDRYALDLAYELAHRLALAPRLERGASTAMELGRALGFDPQFLPALGWLLERLSADGALERSAGEPPVYRARAALRRGEVAELRELGLAHEPELARTLDLLDAAAEAWPAVARGGTTGEQELFGAGRIGLWTAYFHNRNAVYAISNRLTAIAAANRLPAGGARVLEVGAGAGSATEALLAEVEARGRLGQLGRYDVTEPSPFFRRRAERELRSRFGSTPLRFAALDLDRPLAEQGIEPGYDLVVGVNVLHVARSLPRALRELAGVLAPGGWLVAGECLRLFPAQPVAADLVFQIFEGFLAVETEPGLRPTHGFLEPRHWRASLAAAGFVDVEVVPDLERIRDYYPRFSAGVLVGRVPGGSSPARDESGGKQAD